MSDKITDELLPCPFCGSDEHLFVEPDEYGSGGQWVGPISAGCSARTGCGVAVTRDEHSEAITAWNTRAHPTDEEEVGRVKAALRPLVNDDFPAADDWLDDLARAALNAIRGK